MRKYLILFGVILAYVVFCSKSCETTEKHDNMLIEAEVELEKDSLRSEFESDDLSIKTMHAFEEKAKEKLIDFSEFHNIYFDKSLDDTLKRQVMNMISDLFIDNKVQISLCQSKELISKSITIEALNNNDSSKCKPLGFHFDSIVISEPLHRYNHNNYTGSLKFSFFTTPIDSLNNARTFSSTKKAEFFAIKVNRFFGADTLQIWKVMLGDIK